MRYMEYGRYASEWTDFTLRMIEGRSIIVDGHSADAATNQETDPSSFSTYYTTSGRRLGLIKVETDQIRSLIGNAPILLAAQFAMASQSPTATVGGTWLGYRLITSPDYTDATYRYSDGSTTTAWYGNAYAPVPGQDKVTSYFTSLSYTGTQGVNASTWDNFLDVITPLRWSLLRGRALEFVLASKQDNSGSSSGMSINWASTSLPQPHLQMYYLFPVEFFKATTSGEVDMASMVDNSNEENLYYLGAMEAGDTGNSVQGFIKNFGTTTLPHIEILDDHPEWTNPAAATGNTGTGRMDYVALADTADSQAYTITFTSATAFDVKAESYRDNIVSHNASGGGAGWTGTTSSDFVAPSGGLTIPTEAWQPGTLVNDVFTFYVRGNSTETSWPADSNDQVYITSDSGGSPVTAGWRPIDGRRTKSTASVTIDATSKQIPVRAIESTLWDVGDPAFIADDDNIDEGQIASAQEASIGTATQSVGTGLDDVTASGNYYGTTEHTVAGGDEYGLKISTAAGTDKFQYTDDGGSTWSSEITMTGSAQQLGSTDIYVTWAATTGHTLNDEWTIDVKPFAITLSGLTANSNAYSSGARVGTSLPIRNTAPSVWGLSTAAAGASETVKNRVYVEGPSPDFDNPTDTGFQVSDEVYIVDVTNDSVYEYATVQTVGSTYLDFDSNLTQDYPDGSMLVVRGSGEVAFHLRVVSDASTLEELKEARLNVRV